MQTHHGLAGTRSRSALCIAAVAATLATFAVGCGDDEQGTADTASQAAAADELTKARYIERSDATCARLNRKLRQTTRFYLTHPWGRSPERLSTVIVERQVIPKMGLQVDHLRALAARSEEGERALPMVDEMQRVLDDAATNPVAFMRASKPFAKSERLAGEFGFEVCGGL
jgi:hypothetical protein